VKPIELVLTERSTTHGERTLNHDPAALAHEVAALAVSVRPLPLPGSNMVEAEDEIRSCINKCSVKIEDDRGQRVASRDRLDRRGARTDHEIRGSVLLGGRLHWRLSRKSIDLSGAVQRPGWSCRLVAGFIT